MRLLLLTVFESVLDEILQRSLNLVELGTWRNRFMLSWLLIAHGLILGIFSSTFFEVHFIVVPVPETDTHWGGFLSHRVASLDELSCFSAKSPFGMLLCFSPSQLSFWTLSAVLFLSEVVFSFSLWLLFTAFSDSIDSGSPLTFSLWSLKPFTFRVDIFFSEFLWSAPFILPFSFLTSVFGPFTSISFSSTTFDLSSPTGSIFTFTLDLLSLEIIFPSSSKVISPDSIPSM